MAGRWRSSVAQLPNKLMENEAEWKGARGRGSGSTEYKAMLSERVPPLGPEPGRSSGGLRVQRRVLGRCLLQVVQLAYHILFISKDGFPGICCIYFLPLPRNCLAGGDGEKIGGSRRLGRREKTGSGAGEKRCQAPSVPQSYRSITTYLR